MEYTNHTEISKNVEVDKNLDKYENHPLPLYKTERAVKNLISIKETVKQMRERMHSAKTGRLSKEI